MATKSPEDVLFAFDQYQKDLDQLLQVLKSGGKSGAAVALMQSLTTQDIGMMSWSVPTNWRSEASGFPHSFEEVLSGIQRDLCVLRRDFISAEGGLPTLTMLTDQISASVSRILESKSQTGPSSQPTINRPSILHRIFKFFAARPRVRITREQYNEIGQSALFFIQEMADANNRVNTYLAQAIGTKPTPVQWARAVAVFVGSNTYGVLESAQNLDHVLKLNGQLARRFARLMQLVNRLVSVQQDYERVSVAKAVVSELPSIARMLKRIEREHVKNWPTTR